MKTYTYALARLKLYQCEQFNNRSLIMVIESCFFNMSKKNCNIAFFVFFCFFSMKIYAIEQWIYT